ncbi:MAG: hypothetical protein ACYC5M_06780 [Anaerolineae bacterium]
MAITTLTPWSCFNPLRAPGFCDHEGHRTLVLTHEGFVPISRLPRRVSERLPLQLYPSSISRVPFIALVSRDGRWTVSQTQSVAGELFNNGEYSCQHVHTGVTLAPGEQATVSQRTYFIRGGPEGLLVRWASDFGMNQGCLLPA